MMFDQIRNVPDNNNANKHLEKHVKLCEHVDLLYQHSDSLVRDPVLAFIDGETREDVHQSELHRD